MANPTDTGAYPAYASKQAMLRDVWASKGSMGLMQSVAFRISNTDFDALADKCTIYNPTGVFAASV